MFVIRLSTKTHGATQVFCTTRPIIRFDENDIINNLQLELWR